jgi:hypothetical protein
VQSWFLKPSSIWASSVLVWAWLPHCIECALFSAHGVNLI